MQIKFTKIAPFAVAAFMAAALKLHYSMADVNDLRWILAPTAWLVELISGIKFTFESHAGYMSGDNTFIIAAPCSGVNFFITAFLMLSFMKAFKKSSSWSFIPVAAFLAFLTAIIANTTRIYLALALRQTDTETIGLNAEQFHRFEGIVVYFSFLLLLYFLNEKLSSASQPKTVYGIFSQLSVPLAIYYAMTLGIPFANGAYRQGTEFWEHAVFVFLVPLVLIVPFAVFRICMEWRNRYVDATPADLNLQ